VVKIEQIREIPQWDNAAMGMPTNSTLLFVHTDPAQLSLLSKRKLFKARLTLIASALVLVGLAAGLHSLIR
jgi:hypothetical protein